MGIKRFRAVNDIIRAAELCVELFEDDVGEAGADVADSFKGLGGGVVAGEKEGAVDGGSFAFAVISAQNDKIEGVANAGEVVFLDL